MRLASVLQSLVAVGMAACLYEGLAAEEPAKPLPRGIQEVRHHSEALKTEKRFLIHVPEQNSDTERFPVLYIMHGKTGDCTDWPMRTRVAELARNFRMILVFPDGGTESWYLDSPLMPESQYETYITKDLREYVDANYPTVDDREGRGIMGLSMGGHGALMFAAKYPHLYGSASSLSGILKLTNHGDRSDVAARLGPLEENRRAWEQNSVYDLAERFQTAEVRILFDCGRDDKTTGAIWDSRMLRERLLKLQVPHIWRELEGTHSWEYWGNNLEEHLNFHQASMIGKSSIGDRWMVHYFKRLQKFADENAALAITPAKRPTVAMLGSSSAEGFPRDLLPGYTVFNRGISSDRLGIGARGLSHRMELSVFDMKPDFVFIKNGRNDLGVRHNSENGEPTEDRMIEEYAKIVDTIRRRLPQARLYICTSAPVRDGKAHLAPSIASYNDRLRALAKEKEVGLVDLHAGLMGEDGLLKPEYSRDGLHITRAGNEVWAKLMMDAMRE